MTQTKQEMEAAAAANAVAHPGKRKKCGSVSYNAFIAGVLWGVRVGFEKAREYEDKQMLGAAPGVVMRHNRYATADDFLKDLE